MGHPAARPAPGTCSNWFVERSPTLGHGDNDLRGIAGTAPDDVWADGQHDQPATVHWNGRKWKPFPAPTPEVFGLLYGVAAVSRHDIWAVGTDEEKALTQHWDGTQWSAVEPANPGSNFNGLNAVAAIAADEVWAVGAFSKRPHSLQALIEHWDGAGWTTIRAPDEGGKHREVLRGVAAFPDGDVVAVGQHRVGAEWKTLVERCTPPGA